MEDEKVTILLKDDYDKDENQKKSLKFTEEEMMQDLKLRKEMFKRDLSSIIAGKIEAAEKKGIKIEKKEIALEMKQKGFSIALISEITSLTTEEVNNL